MADVNTIKPISHKRLEVSVFSNSLQINYKKHDRGFSNLALRMQLTK